MSLFRNILGVKKTPVIDQERLQSATVPEVSPARPARAMTYREAFITYESGYKRRGVVMDFSRNGVRLRFPTMEKAPEFVMLNAAAVGLKGPARVVWQNGTECGVTLVEDASSDQD